MNRCYIDFETYYNTADGYTLKKMSLLQYIRDRRFKVFGAGISFNGKNPVWYNGSVLRDVLAQIDWTNQIVIAHNVKFDGAILRWIYGINPARYDDTLSMSRAVLGCKLANHSLATVSAHFGLAPKGFLRTDGLSQLTLEQEKELADYCKHDTELCVQLHELLGKDFPEGQYPVMDWAIRCFIDGGFVLNGPLLEAAYKAEKIRRGNIFKEFAADTNVFDASFDIRGHKGFSDAQAVKTVFASNVRFAKLLESRGYEVPYKKSPKQKNDDGSAKEIPALAVGDIQFLEMRHSGNPELESLCEARIAAKSNLLETRSLKFLEVSKLGVFPFDLNFSGAVNTHRFSGASGAGGNPQNLTRGSVLRESVSAPDGKTILVADFNAIEARIVAFIARETALMDEFMRPGGDPYSAFASEVYQRKITKADKKERQFGKTCILGLGYGMGPKKFKYKVRLDTGLVIPDEEAERVVRLYRNRYERIPGMWDLLNRYIPYLASGATVRFPGIPFLEVRNHCVYLPSGLRLQYPNLRQERIGRYDEWVFDSKGEKSKLYGGKLLENISQALAGELCKMAITRATAAQLECKGQVHDEILALVPNNPVSVNNGLKVLLGAMETPPSWWPSIVLKAEGGAGPNWLKAKV